jgi:hypothetical protein
MIPVDFEVHTYGVFNCTMKWRTGSQTLKYYRFHFESTYCKYCLPMGQKDNFVILVYKGNSSSDLNIEIDNNFPDGHLKISTLSFH